MSADPPSSATDSLAEAHRLALASLREMGMELAKDLHAQSKQPDADLGDVATKFARVARAVRHTIALEARFADEARRRAAEAAGPEGSLAHVRTLIGNGLKRAEARQRQAENKLEAVTLVRRAMRQAAGVDGALFAALDERLYERLDLGDEAFSLFNDPAETVRGICRDLGLDPDWNGFSSLDWRQVSRETRAALTGEAMEALPGARHQRRPPRTLPPRTLPVSGRCQAHPGPGP